MSSVNGSIQASLAIEATLLLVLVSLVAFTGNFAPVTLPRVTACAQNQCNFLKAWGSAGSGMSNFNFPAGIAINPLSGNVYVVDAGNNRVHAFNATGSYLTGWGCATANTTACSSGSLTGQFNHPFFDAVDSSGNVYVTDQSNNRVQKFASNGTFILAWGSSGSFAGEFSSPKGIAANQAGDLYVVDSGNERVQKFASNGTFLAAWGCPFANSTACTAGSSGGSFTNPLGIAADTFDNVYVTDTGNNRVEKFTSAGTFIGAFGCALANQTSCGIGSGDGAFSVPTGVAVDSSGSVYVADYGNSLIQKFYGNGTYITQWGPPNIGHPEGLAVNQFSGNVYVTDVSNEDVEIFGYTLACAL